MNKKIIATGISAFLVCGGLFFSGANAIQYKVQGDSTSIFIESDSGPITIHRGDDPLEIEGDTCDPYKTCEHNYTNSGTYIIAIDSESAQNITELRLRNSNITEIIDMEGGINIEELDLSYNHIENLGSNAFNGLNNIENLNLSNNKINNISKYAFSGSVIQNGKLMTYELHSAQVDPNYPYYREYWVTRVGNGIPCVRGQQTSSQICIDEANRTINLSNNELSNIPTFIENRENGSDSIEWTKLILADNATREYEYLVGNHPTTWINVSRIINLKKNNLLSPVSVGSKDVAYNGPNLRSAPYSGVYVTRDLYNSRSSNITSSYILTDPAGNIFTGNVNGILTGNEATEFGITPFHPKDGDDKYETAHRINGNYTIDIKILSGDEVITTGTGAFDLEFVHAEILGEKLQSINNPKFKVSRSHQLAPIHRTLSSTCQLIIDNEEHYCYPIDYLNTQISSMGREDIDVIIDKNKISNDEGTGYIKIDILNRRDEPVVSDTLYFDYNKYTETNYTVNHYRQNVDGNSRSLADTETFTGIVDDEITPSTKTYTGFTSPNTQSGIILSGGLLTINYYYTRNRYTVTYDSNGGTPIADTGILFEATIPTPTPSKDGYTFNTWLGLPSGGKMPATGITLTAEWIENSNPGDPSTPEQTVASYTVKHFKQSITKLYSTTPDEVETFTGIIGDIVSPNVKSYTGFTSPSTTSGTIVSGNSLVIEYRYPRNTYTVTYDSNGGTPIADTGILFEATIPTPTPSKNGFTFEHWNGLPKDGKMPATGITLTAEWIENSNPGDPSTPEQTIASYTVKHFKQSITKLYSTTPDEVETFTGIIGDIVSPNVKSYTGFTSPSTTSGTIVSGNSLVIEYRYPRNTYTVTYDSNGGTPIADTGILFEATIPTPTPSKDGYTFEHWNGLPKDGKMPATGVTLTAVWTENSNPGGDPSTPEQTIASYTVKHFKQSITKLYSTTPDEVETFTGIIGDIVSPNVKSYTGFTSPSTTSGTIVSGNSLVIEYRYPRNTYTVTYDSNGGTPIADTGILFEATIPTPTPSKDGYTFEHWNGLPKDGKMPATGVTLTAVRTENSNPGGDPSTPEQTIASYTVKHFKQDVDGSGWSLADTETFTGIVDDIVTPSTKTYTGFSSPNTESKTIPSNGELTINYYYTRNTYTVNYNTNGGDSITSVNVMFEGIIPTPTPNKNGYSFNGWSGLPTSGLMPANDIILTADWTANSGGGNGSSSSSSSSNGGSSSKGHSSEKTESKTGTIISSGIIMQPINPIASGIIQPTTGENYIMKYISRSCKPYNIEYIPELDAYTSPDLKKKEYFVNFDYLKRYVDSKNAQNAECYIERTWVTTGYIDMNDYTDRFIAPNGKIYFISEENGYYMSSQLSSPKTFATISELKKYIKDRNPLTSMLIYPQTSVTPREFGNTSLKNNSSSNEISTNTIKDNKKDEDVLSELRNQLFSD